MRAYRIDRGDIRRKSTAPGNIRASPPGAGYGQFEHKADSLIAKIEEAGETAVEIDAWAESPRLSPLWLSASSSACHGLLIITVITPLPTKPMRQNARGTEAGERGTLPTCRCVSVMLLRSMQNTRSGGWQAVENDALRDDVAAGRRRLHISSLSVSAWSYRCLRRDNAASPRLADTAERDYFALRERLITMQKQLEGTQKYINEQRR